MQFSAKDADGGVVKEDCTLDNGMASCNGTTTDTEKNGNVGSRLSLQSLGQANSIAVQVASDAPAGPGGRRPRRRRKGLVGPQPSRVRVSMRLGAWGRQ